MAGLDALGYATFLRSVTMSIALESGAQSSKPPLFRRSLVGGAVFYLAYYIFVVALAFIHVNGRSYHGSPEQARSALGVVVAETAFWGIPFSLVQGLTLAWCIRRVRLPLRVIIPMQVGLAALSVLLSNLVSPPEAVLFTPMALTAFAYGVVARRVVAAD
jgi:hypothetical protein